MFAYKNDTLWGKIYKKKKKKNDISIIGIFVKLQNMFYWQYRLTICINYESNANLSISFEDDLMLLGFGGMFKKKNRKFSI